MTGACMVGDCTCMRPFHCRAVILTSADGVAGGAAAGAAAAVDRG